MAFGPRPEELPRFLLTPSSLPPSLPRALGFDGKSLIHPKTVGEANKAFGPRPEELAHAERVLQAWRDAQAHGEGKKGGREGGRLEELAHAERVLQAWRDAQAHGEGMFPSLPPSLPTSLCLTHYPSLPLSLSPSLPPFNRPSSSRWAAYRDPTRRGSQ